MKMINKVLIGVAIMGMALIIAGFALGGNRQIRNMYDNRELHFGWGGNDFHDINAEFTDIHNLDFDLDAAEVEIKEYDGSSIKVVGNVRDNTDIQKEGQTLVIKEKDHWTIFNFDYWDSSKITVYIPGNTEFNTVNLDIDAGSVRNSGILKASNVEVNLDAGSFKGDTIICNNGTFDVDAGKIEINLLDSQRSEFDVSAGKIDATLIGEEKDYAYDVECDAGSVKIGNYSAGGLSSSETGGFGSRQIKADCEAGSINLRMRGV